MVAYGQADNLLSGARIEVIDASDALAMPGVAAVIMGRDLPTPYLNFRAQ